jgi:hypothetical protein
MNYWAIQGCLIPIAALLAWYGGRWWGRRRQRIAAEQEIERWEQAEVMLWEDNSFIVKHPHGSWLAVMPTGAAMLNPLSADRHFESYSPAERALQQAGYCRGSWVRTTIATLRAENANLFAAAALPGWVKGETP